MTSIEEQVKKIIIGAFHIDKASCRNDAHLILDFGVDSMRLVELAMALEEQFAITIDDDCSTLTTVQHVIDYVTRATTSS
ncbi:MAG: acyl carrier protein [Nannocystis sp.]|nr:acyl carrier protein [Nannocystis sp.]